MANDIIGAALGRRGGDSALKGAAEGYFVEGGLETLVPLAVTFAVGWGMLYCIRRGLGVASTSRD
jgi:hypothetical protein